MEAVLFVVLAIVAVLFGTGVYAAVRAKRAVQRRIPQAVRRAEDLALRARTVTRPGAPGEVARLRLDLRSSLESTRAVLEAGSAEDGQLADALRLCDRLDAQAGELDAELRALEREPAGAARTRLQETLPELRDRAERIGHAADSLRWAAQDRARHASDDELTRLSRDVELEAGALRHWTPAADPADAPRGRDGGPAAVGPSGRGLLGRARAGRRGPGAPAARERRGEGTKDTR